MSVLEAAIGWLAPPQCISCGLEGSALCDNCSNSGILPYGERCGYCSKLSSLGRTCSSCHRPGSPRYMWISTVHDGLAAELIKTYKFGHLRAAAKPIATTMRNTFRSYVDTSQAQALDYLIVPVPTATSRMRQRGFDHAALLAKDLSRKMGLEHAEAMGRSGQSRQVGASRAERLSQQAGSFFIRQPHRVAGRNILLVDDVTTTGGTLTTAGQTLRAAGAKHVDALVFAKRL